MNDKLTAKQQRFVDEYVVCLNGTEAARRAKYDGDDATLAVIASQNLRKLNIANALSAKLSDSTMSRNEVSARLTDIARGDIADVVNGAGATDLDEAKRRGKSHLVKKYKVKVTTITEGAGTKNPIEREIVETEIEMYSALDAINSLAKIHNLTNTVKLEIDYNIEIVALLKSGTVTPEDVITDVGFEIAQDIFNAAGLSITTSGES